MKIEKINDSQIRCTLNTDDLIDRELKISELAYGTNIMIATNDKQ